MIDPDVLGLGRCWLTRGGGGERAPSWRLSESSVVAA